MTGRDYLRDRASQCRELARRSVEVQMADALIELAEHYEAQVRRMRQTRLH